METDETQPLEFSRNSLIGKTLNVVAVTAQPFMTNFRTVNGIEIIEGGLFGTLFNIIRDELGFDYNLTLLNGYRYGNFINGTWDGMIGYLGRSDVDMTVSELSLTVDRYQLIDFGLSFVAAGRNIFIRKVVQEELINWKFYSAPFSPRLHIASIISVVFVFGFLLWGTQKLTVLYLKKYFRSFTYLGTQIPLDDSLWTGFSCFCQKGAETVPSGRTPKIVFLLFYVTSLMIFTAYTATLISQLSVIPPVEIPFSDLQDFVQNSKGWAGGPIKGDLTQLYMEKVCPALLKLGPNSQCELLVQLWDKVVKPQSDRLPTSFQQGVDRVIEGKFAFIAIGLGTRHFINTHLDETEACKIYEMEGDYVSSNLAFGFRKNFPYKAHINDKVLRLQSSGIIKRLERIWFPQKTQCDSLSSSLKQVGMKDIGTLPLLWLLGGLISILLLVLELMCR